jgi:predicted ATP-grasp superfamily ATP-dependent carboligase
MRDRAALAGAKLVLPDHATVLRAFDKAETTRIAREAGVETPKTTLLQSRADLEHLLQSSRYPLVVKPAASAVLEEGAGVRSTGGPHYASTPDELRVAFDAVHTRTSRMIAQEFVPGRGAGYFALMVHGAPRAEFAHRRIRDVRPSGSGSSVREAVAPDPVVREAALRVLRELGWHGVAMVEFRVRPDGVPVFLEVNGRFWNSLALAVNAGVDFPAMVAALAEHGDVPASAGYRIGTRCRWLLGDARHLIAVMRGRPRGFTGDFPQRLRTMRDFVTPVRGTFHDNFTLDDPLPELGDWLDFLVHKIPASLSARGKA